MRERGSRHADAANDHNEQRQRHCEPRPNNPAAGKAMKASPRTSPLTNNALLVARCHFPRRHAELIDVPIADDHLDRGYHFLVEVLRSAWRCRLNRKRSSSSSIAALAS